MSDTGAVPAAANKRVRWTEHGPEPIEDEPETAEATPAADADANDPEAVRARLAARGMVRTRPAVRIRDVAASPPRPSLDRELVEAAQAAETAQAAQADDANGPETGGDLLGVALDDAEILEPDPGGPRATVACLTCRATQEVALGATGYRCRSCTRVWRWAVCESCDELAVTLARQESWRCRSCGAATRSWWRTPVAGRRAFEVADRRRVDAAGARRTRVAGTVRRQRGRVIAGVVLVVLVGAFVLLAGRVGTGGDAETGARAETCGAYRELAGDLAGGGLSPGALRARLEELADGAAGADDAVRIGAERLAASGRPGDPAFEEAKAALDRLCPG